MSRNFRVILFAFLVFSSLLLAALILGDWLPWLRGPAPETSEWYWPYQLRPFSRWWAPILSALILWVLSAWWLIPTQTNRRRDLLALCALIASSFILQLTLIYADNPELPAELVNRTLSNLASGFFEAAAEVEDMGLLLQTYPQAMPAFISDHARTHPPGLIAANWLTIKAFSEFPPISTDIARLIWPLRCTDLWLLNRPPEVAAALGFWSLLPLLAAALTALPAFALARLLLHGRTIRLATLLAATIPALLLFAPKSVQLYAPLTLTLFWLFQMGLNKRSSFWLFVAGCVLSLMTFLSLGNTALILLFVLYTLSLNLLAGRKQLTAFNQPVPWITLIKLLFFFAVGSISIWFLYWIIWGTSPLAIAQTGLQQHYKLVTSIRRYDWWLSWNIVDLILFAGWPLMLGFLGGLFLLFRQWRKKSIAAVDILAFSLLLLVILLNISGSARGEVGRIWLFFMPLLAFPAARFWQRALPGKGSALTLVGLQLLLLVSLGVAWRPVRAVIVVAEKPAIAEDLPQVPLDIQFQDRSFSLTGYTLHEEQVHPGSELGLTLFWRANGPAQRPYTVFNHLLNDQGSLVAQLDNWPINGTWPPTCWRAGENIVDPYTIRLPEDLPPGRYQLLSGLYDAQTGERLSTTSGTDAVTLETINIFRN